MNIHNIHGTNVGFHDGASEARDFLSDGIKSHIAEGYFKLAKERGSYHFSNEKGQEYKITHEKGDDGKDVFSVAKSHY